MRKIVGALLALVMAFSLCTITYAGDTSNINFTGYTAHIYNYSKIADARQKLDSSPVYIAIASASNKQLRVKAEGSNSQNGSFSNCTYNSNAQSVSYVTISTEALPLSRRIRSCIYENGFSWGRLSGSTPEVLGNTISGHWSVDSSSTSTPYAD